MADTHQSLFADARRKLAYRTLWRISDWFSVLGNRLAGFTRPGREW